MEILIEIVGMLVEMFTFSAEEKNAPRKIRLIGFVIIFFLMGILFYLAYVVRNDTFTMSFFVILGTIMAITLMRSYSDIVQLIRNEEI
jgi:cation transport ATPase